jgi:hypothetical protein
MSNTKRGYSKIDFSQKVNLLVEENPKKLNSKAYERFNIYLDLKKELDGEFTVKDFIDAGGLAIDIKYDTNKQFIELV